MALKAYRQQGELWGPSPDVVVGAGHVGRAINEIIESLGLERQTGDMSIRLGRQLMI